MYYEKSRPPGRAVQSQRTAPWMQHEYGTPEGRAVAPLEAAVASACSGPSAPSLAFPTWELPLSQLQILSSWGSSGPVCLKQ